jgi:hypothetical protein
MKKIKIIALAITLLTACTKENNEITTGPAEQTVTTTSMSKQRPTRPFSINVYTMIDTDPSISPTPCTGDLPGLANPGHFIHGTGSHIGNLDPSSRLQDVTCDLNATTALLTTSIAGQFAAANGDLIYFTGDDVINVYNLLYSSGTSGEITGTWTITGGTGRFTGATGSLEITGYVSFITFTLSFTGDGTITY